MWPNSISRKDRLKVFSSLVRMLYTTLDTGTRFLQASNDSWILRLPSVPFPFQVQGLSQDGSGSLGAGQGGRLGKTGSLCFGAQGEGQASRGKESESKVKALNGLCRAEDAAPEGLIEADFVVSVPRKDRGSEHLINSHLRRA